MVRLVFRPYTQVRRSICTLESLRASIRVSPDFALLRHSSPSFGSQRIRSGSDRPQVSTGRWCSLAASHLRRRARRPLLSLRTRVCHPNTRVYVRLLGPCFKTGRSKPSYQNREHASGNCSGNLTRSGHKLLLNKARFGWPHLPCCTLAPI